MTIIPAIDLIDGRCVRLTRGDFSTSVEYSADPLDTARQFEAAGIQWLHLVDLDGAKSGAPKHYYILEAIKSQTGLRVDFGGGLRDRAAIVAAFERGADLVTIGSAAVRHPTEFAGWLDDFGAERIILAADVRDRSVATSGWTETSGHDLTDTLTLFRNRGLSHVMITDISRDGTLEGPAVELYAEIKAAFPDLFVIASGGVGTLNDLVELERAGCDAAIVGKALYEGRIDLAEITRT